MISKEQMIEAGYKVFGICTDDGTHCFNKLNTNILINVLATNPRTPFDNNIQATHVKIGNPISKLITTTIYTGPCNTIEELNKIIEDYETKGIAGEVSSNI